MQANTFYISLTPQQAVPMIDDFIQRGSITGELIDRFVADSPNGGHCVISIYEKHFWRAGNRLTLTVTIDDFYGKTRVHTVGGGGGSDIINFDWGAAESFSNSVSEVLGPYIVP